MSIEDAKHHILLRLAAPYSGYGAWGASHTINYSSNMALALGYANTISASDGHGQSVPVYTILHSQCQSHTFFGIYYCYIA